MKLSIDYKSSVISVILLPLFVYLGFWQLGRMEEKETLFLQLKAAKTMPTVSFNELNQLLRNEMKEIREGNTEENTQESNGLHNNTHLTKLIESLRYRKVAIEGQFLTKSFFLLDNQLHKGMAGYHIVVPFQLKDSEYLILANFGWIAAEHNRTKLPNIELDAWVSRKTNGSSDSPLIGTIIKPANPLILKKEILSNQKNGPILIQKIDFPLLSSALDQPLIPILIDLSDNISQNNKILPIDFKSQANKHLGYAVQWFTIALVALIYYLVINTRRKTNKL